LKVTVPPASALPKVWRLFSRI